jgi:hypothetical protein
LIFCFLSQLSIGDAEEKGGSKIQSMAVFGSFWQQLSKKYQRSSIPNIELTDEQFNLKVKYSISKGVPVSKNGCANTSAALVTPVFSSSAFGKNNILSPMVTMTLLLSCHCIYNHYFRYDNDDTRLPQFWLWLQVRQTFALRELLAFPRCTIEEYTAWGDYIDILKRIIDGCWALGKAGREGYLGDTLL